MLFLDKLNLHIMKPKSRVSEEIRRYNPFPSLCEFMALIHTMFTFPLFHTGEYKYRKPDPHKSGKTISKPKRHYPKNPSSQRHA